MTLTIDAPSTVAAPEALGLGDRIECVGWKPVPYGRVRPLERAGQRVGERIDHRDGDAGVGEATLDPGLGPAGVAAPARRRTAAP